MPSRDDETVTALLTPDGHCRYVDNMFRSNLVGRWLNGSAVWLTCGILVAGIRVVSVEVEWTVGMGGSRTPGCALIGDMRRRDVESSRGSSVFDRCWVRLRKGRKCWMLGMPETYCVAYGRLLAAFSRRRAWVGALRWSCA